MHVLLPNHQHAAELFPLSADCDLTEGLRSYSRSSAVFVADNSEDAWHPLHPALGPTPPNP
jgi:hypothetical protein